MVAKPYTWPAELLPHTERKHRVLSDYVGRYVRVRCVSPHRRGFKLAVMDGFAGGGRYIGGSPGSPIIFVEQLASAIEAVNLGRAAQKMPQVTLQCRLSLNDADPDVIAILKENMAPALAPFVGHPQISFDVSYSTLSFEQAVPAFRQAVEAGGYKSVLFNLDQCGHSQVDLGTLKSLMDAAPSVEIFYTFMIEAMLAYLSQGSPERLLRQLEPAGVTSLSRLDEVINKEEWLARAEKVVFDTLQGLAPFASPFSINNPEGWRYWLIHLAKQPRARQVYNDVLHANSSSQAHYGRAGLRMLSYNPDHEGALYLFAGDDRERAREALCEDIPRVIASSGNRMSVADFYASVYNQTPAHNDDIHSAMLANPDLEVLTPAGKPRQKPHTIAASDIIKLKRQQTFMSLLGLKR